MIISDANTTAALLDESALLIMRIDKDAAACDVQCGFAVHPKRLVFVTVTLWSKTDDRLSIQDLPDFWSFRAGNSFDAIGELSPPKHSRKVGRHMRSDDDLNILNIASIGTTRGRIMEFDNIGCSIVVISVLRSRGKRGRPQISSTADAG